MRASFAVAVACAGLVIAGWAPSGALAAFPGSNGKIAFVSSRDGNFEIYTIHADRTDLDRLTNNAVTDRAPAWSPDGQKIAFESGSGISVMNADGSNQQPIAGDARYPAWSPSGAQIVFNRDDVLWTMDATGSNQAPLTDVEDNDPAWSPNGAQIAFRGCCRPPSDSADNIYVVSSSGGTATKLTTGGGTDPNWSPDGSQIAFGRGGVTVMSSTGANPQVRGSCANPAWSPQGDQIVCDDSGDVVIINADGTGTPFNVTQNPGLDFDPDWQPLSTPIVFVHGFAGSVIACGGDQLFPDVPVEFPDMRLEADGETNRQEGACNPIAGPTEILKSFLTEDVYEPAVDFLDQIAPGRNYIYAWDWRKAPGRALDGLDLMVERARCGGTLPSGATTCATPVSNKVVLMGHSMGGLVIRDYINDQSRADKISRALTVGTPYWGSPKAIFPLAAGLESPAAEGLDSIIVDDEFHEWARNAQGLYFLYPSASFGDWLTVAGREPRPLDRPGLLRYVSDLGGNTTLLERALNGHAQSLDGFETNGIDFQAFVGSGLATVERVLFFEAAGQDYVKLTYADGDGTVPVRSGTQGPQGTADPLGEDIPIHYSCGIAHVPLPGDPAVTGRIKNFLLDGAAIAAGPSSCSSSGFQIEIYEIDLAARETGALDTAFPGLTVNAGRRAGPMTLEEAELAGLIELLDMGAQKVIVTDSRTPVELSYSNAQFELSATPLTDANLGQTSYYGPLSGATTISAGSTLSIADANGPVTPRSDGAPDLSIADASAAEGSDLGFTVTLSRAAGFPVAVDFKTEDATAAAGSDYSSSEGTLVFEPGQTSKALTIPSSADASAEGSETFGVRLTNPIDGEISDDQALGTIIEPSGTGGDTTVDGAKLTAKRTQKQKRKKIKVKLAVGAAEDVTVLATGKVKVKKKSYALKKVTKTLTAGDTETIKLTPKKSSSAGKIAGALKRDTKVVAALSATFTDKLANSSIETAVVKLK